VPPTFAALYAEVLTDNNIAVTTRDDLTHMSYTTRSYQELLVPTASLEKARHLIVEVRRTNAPGSSDGYDSSES
jgi:hypothetical protein